MTDNRRTNNGTRAPNGVPDATFRDLRPGDRVFVEANGYDGVSYAHGNRWGTVESLPRRTRIDVALPSRTGTVAARRDQITRVERDGDVLTLPGGEREPFDMSSVYAGPLFDETRRK